MLAQKTVSGYVVQRKFIFIKEEKVVNIIAHVTTENII